MRETFHSYRKKAIASMRNPLTRLSAERIAKDQEIAPDSLQSKSATPQKKADCQAGPPERKNKRHHIPFVALALVVLFMSLCTLSLLEMHPPALALDNPGANPVPTAASALCNAVSGQALVDCNNCVAHGYTGDTFNLCRQLASEVSDPKCKGYEGIELKNCLITDQTLPPSCQNAQTSQDIDTCINNLATVATPTAAAYTPTAAAAPASQTTSYLLSTNNKKLGYGDSCDHLNSSLLSAYPSVFADVTNPRPPVSFCWNQSDFLWGARDITCIVNDGHDWGSPVSQYFGGTITTGPAPANGSSEDPPHKDVSGTVNLNKITAHNQNTCTDNSTCVSNNASGNDLTDTSAIHDETGGDDIICANNACTNTTSGTTDDCGDPTGKQLEYDRFGCQAVNGAENLRDGGQNADFDKANAPTSKGYEWDKYWDATGVYTNPTAFDPNSALYLRTALLHTDLIKPNRDLPQCDAEGRWECVAQDGSNENVVVLIQSGNFTQRPNTIIKDVNDNTHLWKVEGFFGTGVPVFWVACNSGSGGWAFPCSDTDASSNYGGNMPFISAGDSIQSLDNGQVNPGVISKDWLSGNADPSTDNNSGIQQQSNGTPIQGLSQPGHLVYTYLNDTVDQPGMVQLFPIMLGAGYALLAPVVVLIGYQLLWSSWTLVRIGILESFGRIILSVVAVGVSASMISMLIGVTNTLNLSLVALHKTMPYHDILINNRGYSLTLEPQGENDPLSFRGVVVPISRWGCIANDFVALIANKFWTDAAGFVPFVGGIGKFVGNIFNAIDVAQHIGEFVVLILSITLCTQVFVRIMLLNFYVLTGPLALACWALPGGTGRSVIRSWAKGLFSLLLVQTAQVFILAVFPLIMPPFPTLPADGFGLLNMVFQAVPRILVLVAAVQVPKLMGTQATRAMAQAGTVVGGAVVAAGGMAMSTV